MVEFTISADNYLTLVQQAEVKVRSTTNVDISLRPKPKNAAVEVGKTEIKIKQQIQFALDSAVILPESFGLMTEIADVLIRNPRIKRVEIQGHTDNTGTPESNKQLSERRADSVRLWLTQHGVTGDRLVARGFGQEKPLVPNVTAQNRSRNRRVQFQIVEQDPPAKP
jgi:outer membrane protein OmpA-like peptidoglycan-associated protein